MGKRIVIIDDVVSERVVLRGFLEDSGFEVVAEAGDGKDALDICKSFKPDLALMDVKMPFLDGIKASVMISSTCPTPVILMTAKADEDTVKKAVEAGVMAYLIKPIRQEELIPAIELAISRFSEFQLLRNENRDLKNAIEARKLIEKAKGLLMKMEGLTEGDAFHRIRKISMDKRKSMSEIAGVIILAFEGK